jgi:hypothetical protein
MSNLTDRATLEFTRVAIEAFAFISTYGFQLRACEATVVQFASETVFLNVYHGRSSYEIGMEFGLTSCEGSADGYSLAELIRLQAPEEGKRYRRFSAASAGEVQVGVRRLAEHVLRYGERLLKGDLIVFEELRRQRQEWASTFAAKVRYEQVSPKAADAFRRQEYRKAAELYESIRSELTPAEIEKLAFARKRT